MLYSGSNSRMSEQPRIVISSTLETRIDQILANPRVRAVKFGTHQSEREDDHYVTLVLKDGEYRQYSAASFVEALTAAETWLQ